MPRMSSLLVMLLIQALVIALVVACERTDRQAIKYLERCGYKEVWCDGRNAEVKCLADGIHFRCVVSSGTIACETTDPEKVEIKKP